jgi:hypothetical protein
MTRLAARAVIALSTGMLCVTTMPAIAQEATAPQTYSARDEQAAWINDPAFHQFYQATIDAFANGPDRVDRAAYEARSKDIFTAFATSHNMPVEAMLDHLKAIPGEMIGNVTREPEILASYDSFVEALMGPQSFPANAERIGGN